MSFENKKYKKLRKTMPKKNTYKKSKYHKNEAFTIRYD